MAFSSGSIRRISLWANYVLNSRTICDIKMVKREHSINAGVELPRGFICSGGASRIGSSTLAEAEGGRGGEAGRPASKEREGDPEEGDQKGETETQGNLQGVISSKQPLNFSAAYSWSLS